MYLEVVKGGNVFVFFQVVGVFYLRPSGKLVVVTPAGQHEFDGMDGLLWNELWGYITPHAKVGVNLDKKTVYLVGMGE